MLCCLSIFAKSFLVPSKLSITKLKNVTDYFHLHGRNSVLVDVIHYIIQLLICLFIINMIWFMVLNLLNSLLARCGLFVLPDNVDLGTACGKYFRVSCLSIIDPGTPQICILIIWLYHCCDRLAWLLLRFGIFYRWFRYHQVTPWWSLRCFLVIKSRN